MSKRKGRISPQGLELSVHIMITRWNIQIHSQETGMWSTSLPGVVQGCTAAKRKRSLFSVAENSPSTIWIWIGDTLASCNRSKQKFNNTCVQLLGLSGLLWVKRNCPGLVFVKLMRWSGSMELAAILSESSRCSSDFSGNFTLPVLHPWEELFTNVHTAKKWWHE